MNLGTTSRIPQKKKKKDKTPRTSAPTWTVLPHLLPQLDRGGSVQRGWGKLKRETVLLSFQL